MEYYPIYLRCLNVLESSLLDYYNITTDISFSEICDRSIGYQFVKDHSIFDIEIKNNKIYASMGERFDRYKKEIIEKNDLWEESSSPFYYCTSIKTDLTRKLLDTIGYEDCDIKITEKWDDNRENVEYIYEIPALL